MTKDYPVWVCHDCAISAGGKPRTVGSTWHTGVCGVCVHETSVTEPRDYGWPTFTKGTDVPI